MARTTITFLCRECGGESLRWAGQCPHCHAWNTLEEFTVKAGRARDGAGRAPATAGRERPQALPITDVDTAGAPRLSLEWEELNRVLGGGLVPGSLVLISGEPGVGKSTLLMQVSQQVVDRHGPVLYATGEESSSQIGLRAGRLDALRDQLMVLADNDLDQVLGEIERRRPRLAVIDSIQTVNDSALETGPGSVPQVREATARILRMAKETGVTVVLVGHVTKEGAIAGPRLLEHMVDCVLYMEGERRQGMRLLRATKNRFGSTEEVGLFTMGERGLEEVSDPSALLLERSTLAFPGTAAVPILEGTRPLVIELQSLVVPAPFGIPRRTANGYDPTRLHVLIAILEKRGAIQLSQSDVYVNIAGGLRVTETAADLGLALSIAGNSRNAAIAEATVVLGELGLTGEVRPVGQLERRLAEAGRRGFSKAIVPRLPPSMPKPPGFTLTEVDDIAEAIEVAFGPGRRGRGASRPVLTVRAGQERG